MGNKEIENLLEDNYKELCEKSEELKQAISEKMKVEETMLGGKEKIIELNNLEEKVNDIFRARKKKFFLNNLKNFINLNRLSRKYRKRVVNEISNEYFHTTNNMLKNEEFLILYKKLLKVENKIKEFFPEHFFVFDEVSANVISAKDNLLFEAMLETGAYLNKIKEITEA